MKTLHYFNFKNAAAFLIFVFLFATILPAQTPQYYNLNTGTSSNSFPFNMAAGKAVNSLFLAGEFNQPSAIPPGQKIVKVYFRTSSAGTRAYTNLHILLAQDVITTLTSGSFYAGPYDTVFAKDTSLTSTTGGWMCVTLSHGFNYDPTKSLIMFVGQCGYTGTGASVYNSSTTGIRRVWSVGGCPFAPYNSGDAATVNFGVDVIPATPPPPVLLSPPNSSIGVSIAPTFVWNKSTDLTTTNYWWQLTTDSSSLANLQNDSTLTDTTKSITGLSNLTSYFWRVKSKNTGGWGSFSSWFKFTTISVLYYNYNNGTVQNSFPFNQAAGKMIQTLVGPGEFNQPTTAPTGNITNFSVFINSTYPLNSTYTTFKLLFSQTTLTSLPTGSLYSGTWDTVYQRASVTFAASGTWLNFALDHPYSYNPAQSLVIQIEQCASTQGTGYSLLHTNTTGLNRRTYSSGGCPFSYGGTSTYVTNCGINVSPVSGILPQVNTQTPKEFKLDQNYPNPFNPVTKISYEIPKSNLVTLKIYDLLGREVAILVNEVKKPGSYIIDFDGSSFASGTYFYRLTAGNFISTKKMVLIK